MPSITATSDGTQLAYVEHGAGPPVVLVASWSFHSGMWERQVDHLVEAGYRCVCPDRRGCGRSDRPAGGYDLTTTAADLHDLLEHLDLSDAVLVGHSVGAGEVVRCLAQHGADRIRGAVLVSGVLPWLAGAPDGPPPEVVHEGLETLRVDRGRWYARQVQPWFATHLGHRVDPVTVDWLIAMGMASDAWGSRRLLLDAFAADHRADLAALDVPVLVVHGGVDHVVPPQLTAHRVAPLLRRCALREHATAGHGLFVTHADELNDDLTSFLADPSALTDAARNSTLA